MTNLTDELRRLSTPPENQEDFNAWLEFSDAFKFLRANLNEAEFVVYAGLAHTFIHAIAVPASLLAPPNVEDLMAWNCNATSSWGISQTYSDTPTVTISSPLEDTGSKTLNEGEQLVFARHFYGHMGDKNYFEVLQKFVHVFDLHFVYERNAYCRLDKHGDLEDVIRFIKIPGSPEASGGTIVTFDRDLLDRYLTLTGTAIVRTFDFTRWRPSHFAGWSDTRPEEHTATEDLFYRSVIEPGHASYVRGCQIVRSLISTEDFIKRFNYGDRDNEQYASFIAHDWKNDVVKEISCAPGSTANYFTQSDLPFEMSSVFFRPEVLLKYKSDSEKYTLQDRSISCRGTWHLQTYDINDAGQVHTYIVYLRSLPYEEQLHWKACNEAPKGSISKRAFLTDFKGSWDEEYDPLNSLKDKLRSIRRQGFEWWKLRSENLMDQVHYPATTSADEWSNEILHLDQLLVEGFVDKWLRQKATTLGRTPDPRFRSLKLIEECLIALGFEEEHARKITAPFHLLHELRSKIKGHALGEEANQIKKRTLASHGSYRNHFRTLVHECDESLHEIIEAFS
jgi:hypothetical protein